MEGYQKGVRLRHDPQLTLTEYGGERYSREGSWSYTWRKVEPIRWRYLREISTGVAEFISDRVLTTHKWNASSADYEDGTHANNYEKSDIRKWLNGDFMDQVFYYDRSLVQSAAVDNGASTTYSSTNQYACGNTTDYIYLPSYKDVTNKAYGFGTYAERIGYNVDGNATYWWTRSPNPSSAFGASRVSSGKNVTLLELIDGGYDSVNISHGVRSCVQLKIS